VKRHYNFSGGVPADFFNISSLTAKSDTRFRVEDGHIVNAYNENIGDYDYISILTSKRYGGKVTMSTRCSFDSFGAPLIVFTDDFRTDETGHNFYGLHFEIVAYENGINIWHIIPAAEGAPRPIKVTKIAFAEFDVEAGKELELTVTVEGKRITARMAGSDGQIHTLTVENDDIPERFHVGITACEGINRFASFTVEGIENGN